MCRVRSRFTFARPTAHLRPISGIAVAFLLALAPAAGAHPLGNFSINHQTRVKISSDRVDLLYIFDQAEVPTAQERKLSRKEILSRKLREVRERLWLIVNGQRRALHLGRGVKLAFPKGEGGLPITLLSL
jgi:nickel/cobalt exporter